MGHADARLQRPPGGGGPLTPDALPGEPDDQARTGGTAASARVRDAASVVILDMEHGEPRILAGLRGQRHVFMAGRLVFPGGRLDRSDLALAPAFALTPQAETRLTARVSARFTGKRACALALAAIREAYEETGVMLGRSASESMQAGTAPYWRDFSARGVVPEPHALHPFARAVTPPHRVRRYDTRFFAVRGDAIARQVPFDQRPTDEFDTVQWLTTAEMLAFDLAPITRQILEDLRARLDHETLFDAGRPMAFYRRQHGRFTREMI